MSLSNPFSLLPNFRELGGYTAADGRKIKHNIIFRTPCLNGLVTEEQINKFKSFGIKVIFDLRAPNESSVNPDPKFEGIKRYDISAITYKPGETSYNLEDYFTFTPERVDELLPNVAKCFKTLPFDNRAFKTFFKELIEGNVPILFHCAAGKDRTGVLAAIVLLFFGVKKEDIVENFLITNEISENAIADSRKRLNVTEDNAFANHIFDILLRVHAENIENTFKVILEKYQSYDEYFEKEYGITPEIKKQLYDRYLE